MARHMVARCSLVDALGLCLLFTCMNDGLYFVFECLFIVASLVKLGLYHYTKFFAIGVALALLLARPAPSCFPILHFFSITVISTTLASEQRGLLPLWLCQGVALCGAYISNAATILVEQKTPSISQLFDLIAAPRASGLDRLPIRVRLLMPLLVACLGACALTDGDVKKIRHPWLWEVAAFLRVTFSVSQGRNALDCKVRFVQDHLVGLILNKACAETIKVKVDAVEWTQLWARDNLIIIYGLSPRVDYSVHLEDLTGKCCELTVSTNVPEADYHSGVRRQTPMTTLLEARDIALTTLAEEKAKFKKLRKDNNKVLANLRHEIEVQLAKQNKSNKSDERLARKITALQESNKQLQDDINDIETATTELQKSMPESDAVFLLREKEFKQEMERLITEEKQLDAQLGEMRSTRAVLEQEVNRTEMRQLKQSQKLKRLEEDAKKTREQTSASITNSIAQRKRARQQKIDRRMNQQAEFESSIKKLELGVQDLISRTRLFEEARSTW